MSYMTITQVTKYNEGVIYIIEWSYHVMVMVIRLCDIEKIIESSRTNDIISHDKNILALWITY